MRKFNKISVTVLSVAFFASAVFTNACAKEGDDTLQYYLSKAPLIVHAEIITEPKLYMHQDGYLDYRCEAEVIDTIKGSADMKGQKIQVRILRWETEPADRHPLIHKDKESVLFLYDAGYAYMLWETVDHWFGIQHPNKPMIESLKRLDNIQQ